MGWQLFKKRLDLWTFIYVRNYTLNIICLVLPVVVRPCIDFVANVFFHACSMDLSLVIGIYPSSNFPRDVLVLSLWAGCESLFRHRCSDASSGLKIGCHAKIWSRAAGVDVAFEKRAGPSRKIQYKPYVQNSAPEYRSEHRALMQSNSPMNELI